MDGPTSSPAEVVVIWKEDSEKLTLDRGSIQTQELTAQELGILIYAISVLTDSRRVPENRKVEIEDLILRFPEDDPISLILSVKKLIKRDYLEDDPTLDVDMVNLLQEKYGATMQ